MYFGFKMVSSLIRKYSVNWFVSFSFFVMILSWGTMVYAFDISLTWDPNNEPTVDGYKLYYGTSSKNYSESIDIGNNTKYTIKNLKRGQTYFIAVTAYDIEGNESGFSDEISYRDHQNSMPWIDVLLFNDSP